jgi:hypothetical protein
MEQIVCNIDVVSAICSFLPDVHTYLAFRSVSRVFYEASLHERSVSNMLHVLSFHNSPTLYSDLLPDDGKICACKATGDYLGMIVGLEKPFIWRIINRDHVAGLWLHACEERLDVLLSFLTEWDIQPTNEAKEVAFLLAAYLHWVDGVRMLLPFAAQCQSSLSDALRLCTKWVSLDALTTLKAILTAASEEKLSLPLNIGLLQCCQIPKVSTEDRRIAHIRLAIVAMLLDCGAVINTSPRHVLRLAVLLGGVDLFERLLVHFDGAPHLIQACGEASEEGALIACCMHGHNHMLRRLIEVGFGNFCSWYKPALAALHAEQYECYQTLCERWETIRPLRLHLTCEG